MLESAIEKYSCAKAKKAGWLPIKVGHSGWPDRLFLKNGRYVWVEFKQPGKKPRALQKIKIMELTEQKAEVHVISSVAGLMEALSDKEKLL